ADQVAAADDTVGRIEFDPAGARKIDLNPGMRRAAAEIAVDAIAGQEQVARDEACGDAEPPQRLDHQKRVVATGAGAGLQGVERMLRALLMPLAIGERVADAMGYTAQDLEGRRRRVGVEKSARP